MLFIGDFNSSKYRCQDRNDMKVDPVNNCLNIFVNEQNNNKNMSTNR